MYQVLDGDGRPGKPVDLQAIRDMAADGLLEPHTMVYDPISGLTQAAADMFVHEELFGANRTGGGRTTARPSPVQSPPYAPPRAAATAQSKQCPWCGSVALMDAAFCAGCGRKFGTQYGVQQVYREQPVNEQYPRHLADQKSKIVAGLFGILLPGLGIHGFYTGNTALGLTMLLGNIGCLMLTVITFGIGGIIFIPIMMLLHLLGFIQGILYLCASDAEFHQKYVVEKRWF